jgi:Zn-dependent alcohol dehydrogenase
MGEYAACDFGGEAAGVVSQVGGKVSRFKPGDRVVLSWWAWVWLFLDIWASI